MEKEDFLPDNFLKGLFRTQSWESPGDEFTKDVMEQILKESELSLVKKPFYMILRSSWPYVLLFLVSVMFLMTSDIPFTEYIPGKEFFTKNLLPYFGSLFSGFKPLISSVKPITVPLMVILAGSLLVSFDHFLFRKPSIRQQSTN